MRCPALLVLLVALTACQRDDAATAGDPAEKLASDSGASSTASESTEASTATTVTETPTPEPVELGEAPLEPATGEEICAALTVDAATAAIATEVALATASDADTPQCTYTYGGDSATLRTFTVAVQRPDDVEGRGLGSAFDYVLEVNRELAVDTTVEEAEVDAGDRAVGLTGETLTLSVVAAGGRLLTIITTPDLDTAAVEALSAAAADALD